MRVLAVLAHPHRQGLEPAQHEPAVERPRNGAERLLQEEQPLRHGRVVRGEEAADQVGVAAEVLRRRVQDDVGAERERLLQVRRGERIVGDDHRADGVRRLGGGADVDDVQHRVRRRLEPDNARALVEVRGEVLVDLLGLHPLELVALRPVDLREHAVDTAVDVGHGDDAVAGLEQVHQRGGRAEAGREGDAVLRSLERGEADLQRGARGVRDPGVVVALVLADGLLDERRRLVDRDRDRPGCGIRLLAVVDRARLEVHGSILVARAQLNGLATMSRTITNISATSTRATSRILRSRACACGDFGPCSAATVFRRFASGPRKKIPVAAETPHAMSPKMIQKWSQPQFRFSIIPIPKPSTTNDMIGNSRPATTSAQCPIASSWSSSFASSASKAQIVRKIPPPTQITAAPTWNILNTVYHCASAAKTMKTTTSAIAMMVVTTTDVRRRASGGATAT